jgi:hypothetical protein
MTRHAATLPHRASWGQDNGHHDFNSVSAIHPSARMALGLLRPLRLCPSGNPARDRQRRLHRICAVSPRLPPHCRCSGDRQPDLGVDGSDNCRHTTTLVAGKETSQTHTGSDADPTDGPTAPSRGNAGRSLIISMESSHAIWSRRHVAGGCGYGPGARLRHSPDGAQHRDNRRRRCQPTRGNETLCPRVVRSTRCDRWAVS